jgi:predicted anti-sigma-YlaC factor YlaD
MKDSCSSVLKLLEKYFDQEVTNKEKIFIEDHLQNCPACREELRSMEELRTLIKAPFEEVIQKEDFPWLWQKIEREIRLQEKQTWWQSLLSWLNVSLLFKKKVWIPAAVTIGILIFITAQIFFKEMPSYLDSSVVEYVESETHHVMVYNLEKAKVTVIWLFEESEEESSTS